MEEQIIQDTNLEEGNFYCVVSDTEQGFEIVQCDVVIDSGFAGRCLQKCFEESADQFVFKESGEVKVFDTEQVRSILISACIKLNGVYSVDKSEFDEMLLSLNI